MNAINNITDKQQEILEIITTGALKHREGYGFYYKVPTVTRRRGEMKVRQSVIDHLLNLRLISLMDLPNHK